MARGLPVVASDIPAHRAMLTEAGADPAALAAPEQTARAHLDFLDAYGWDYLKVMHDYRIDLPEGLPAASAGLFGYLGYDMIRLVEHLPQRPHAGHEVTEHRVRVGGIVQDPAGVRETAQRFGCFGGIFEWVMERGHERLLWARTENPGIRGSPVRCTPAPAVSPAPQ